MANYQIKIYLIEPIDGRHKKMLVFSDNEEHARRHASANVAPNDGRVYLDGNLSTCIHIEPKLIDNDLELKSVIIQYNEVIYHLHKDEAEDVIAEKIL